MGMYGLWGSGRRGWFGNIYWGIHRGGLHSIFLYVFEDPKPSFQFLPGILGVKASQKF